MGRTWSISLRLFGSAAIWIFIPLTAALFLANIFLAEAIVTPLETKMEADLDEFVRKTEFVAVVDGEISFKGFSDEKYTRPKSGWFAQITAVGSKRDGAAWRSRSLDFEPFRLAEIDPGPSIVRKSYTNAKDWSLKALTKKVSHTLNAQDYYFTILADVKTNIEDTERLNRQLRDRVNLVSLVLIIVIIIGVVLQVKYGLKPLSELKNQINNKREGKQKSIENDVAREIKPISEALNELFTHNDIVLERARSEVGNLSHSLKTPLSVMKNEVRELEGETANLLNAQIENIERHVMSYLDSARNTVLAADKTLSTPVLSRIVPWTEIVKKAFPDKNIAFTIRGSDGLIFTGSQMHLDEVLQNLIENGCKWCNAQLQLTAYFTRHPVTGHGQLSLVVEDDGPGVPKEKYQYVLGRGNRGDEKTPGTGLGLDIVRRIVNDYGGEIMLSRSDLGGLAVTISLPGEEG